MAEDQLGSQPMAVQTGTGGLESPDVLVRRLTGHLRWAQWVLTSALQQQLPAEGHPDVSGTLIAARTGPGFSVGHTTRLLARVQTRLDRSRVWQPETGPRAAIDMYWFSDAVHERFAKIGFKFGRDVLRIGPTDPDNLVLVGDMSSPTAEQNGAQAPLLELPFEAQSEAPQEPEYPRRLPTFAELREILAAKQRARLQGDKGSGSEGARSQPLPSPHLPAPPRRTEPETVPDSKPAPPSPRPRRFLQVEELAAGGSTVTHVRSSAERPVKRPSESPMREPEVGAAAPGIPAHRPVRNETALPEVAAPRALQDVVSDTVAGEIPGFEDITQPPEPAEVPTEPALLVSPHEDVSDDRERGVTPLQAGTSPARHVTAVLPGEGRDVGHGRGRTQVELSSSPPNAVVRSPRQGREMGGRQGRAPQPIAGDAIQMPHERGEDGGLDRGTQPERSDVSLVRDAVAAPASGAERSASAASAPSAAVPVDSAVAPVPSFPADTGRRPIQGTNPEGAPVLPGGFDAVAAPASSDEGNDLESGARLPESVVSPGAEGIWPRATVGDIGEADQSLRTAVPAAPPAPSALPAQPVQRHVASPPTEAAVRAESESDKAQTTMALDPDAMSLSTTGLAGRSREASEHYRPPVVTPGPADIPLVVTPESAPAEVVSGQVPDGRPNDARVRRHTPAGQQVSPSAPIEPAPVQPPTLTEGPGSDAPVQQHPASSETRSPAAPAHLETAVDDPELAAAQQHLRVTSVSRPPETPAQQPADSVSGPRDATMPIVGPPPPSQSGVAPAHSQADMPPPDALAENVSAGVTLPPGTKESQVSSAVDRPPVPTDLGVIETDWPPTSSAPEAVDGSTFPTGETPDRRAKAPGAVDAVGVAGQAPTPSSDVTGGRSQDQGIPRGVPAPVQVEPLRGIETPSGEPPITSQLGPETRSVDRSGVGHLPPAQVPPSPSEPSVPSAAEAQPPTRQLMAWPEVEGRQPASGPIDGEVDAAPVRQAAARPAPSSTPLPVYPPPQRRTRPETGDATFPPVAPKPPGGGVPSTTTRADERGESMLARPAEALPAGPANVGGSLADERATVSAVEGGRTVPGEPPPLDHADHETGSDSIRPTGEAARRQPHAGSGSVDLGTAMLARAGARSRLAATYSQPTITRVAGMPPPAGSTQPAAAAVAPRALSSPLSTPVRGVPRLSSRAGQASILQRAIQKGASEDAYGMPAGERLPLLQTTGAAMGSVAREMGTPVAGLAGQPSGAAPPSTLPLPPAGRMIQRMPVVTVGGSGDAGPVSGVIQRAEVSPGGEAGPQGEPVPPPNLNDLARQVYPIIKRMLAVERERLGRR